MHVCVCIHVCLCVCMCICTCANIKSCGRRHVLNCEHGSSQLRGIQGLRRILAFLYTVMHCFTYYKIIECFLIKRKFKIMFKTFRITRRHVRPLPLMIALSVNRQSQERQFSLETQV